MSTFEPYRAWYFPEASNVYDVERDYDETCLSLREDGTFPPGVVGLHVTVQGAEVVDHRTFLWLVMPDGTIGREESWRVRRS